MDTVNAMLATINGVLWHEYVLVAIVLVGLLFTLWTGFCQYRSLTHGTAVVRGVYDAADDPGAISHFQALSAALSATVGLGNIGGVALAIALGGPGAVFWMWIVGLLGMSIKVIEVTLSMLYRNTDDPDDPHGGPMWVADKGLARLNPRLAWLGKSIATIFCLTLLVSTTTGGNMFQAWNVGTLTQTYFGVPSAISGVILALIVGAVIIGGIKRIGRVAGTLVPFMCATYLLAGMVVLCVNADQVPAMFRLIFVSAFHPAEASGAFIGGTAAYAFLFGMKRAVFSNEAGQGSSPIAHSAARTAEPVREGIVAGLEPFIDTVVVCTFTALVILSSGVWNRSAEATYDVLPSVIPVELGEWSIAEARAPQRLDGGEWVVGQNVFLIYSGDLNPASGNTQHRADGVIAISAAGSTVVAWRNVQSKTKPTLSDAGVYGTYVAASLTALAFDSVYAGLGKYLVTFAAWLFAISTMISWSYYGEQGMVYLAGQRSVLPYRFVFCALIVIATLGVIETDRELDNLTGLGTGVMLLVNVPIVLLFANQAIRAYRNYFTRLKQGEMHRHAKARSVEEDLSGRAD